MRSLSNAINTGRIFHFINTRNTLLAKPRKSRAGWKVLFTRIVASNEEIKTFLNIATILMSMVFCVFVVPQASLRLKSISDTTKCQRACSAVMFDKSISLGKLFYRGNKTCNFFNAIFHKKKKKISGRKGKDSAEIFPSSEY